MYSKKSRFAVKVKKPAISSYTEADLSAEKNEILKTTDKDKMVITPEIVNTNESALKITVIKTDSVNEKRKM